MKIVSSLGLVFDIMGALLLYKFGLPPNFDPLGNQHLITGETDEIEIAKGKRYHKWSRTAVILLMIGFLLQLISNWL